MVRPRTELWTANPFNGDPEPEQDPSRDLLRGAEGEILPNPAESETLMLS